ncbi:MAG: 3-oxoacyl-ACP reductase, partial [Agathobacter rectalis]
RCFDETERAELADEIPAGRFATACEVADMAYSVITAPDYLTGQIITFDGGWI